MIIVCYADVDSLDNDGLYSAAMKKLPPFRRAKADRLRYRKDKNLSVGAWLMLEEALKSKGEDINSLTFNIDTNGKPYISGSDLHFSLSHSGSIALCALSDFPVGADVEAMGHINHKLCKRFFKKNEYDAVFDEKDAHKQEDMFYRIWTLKESFIKYNGKGLGGFSDFEIVPKGNDVIKCKALQVRFWEFDIPGYKVSVCGKDGEISFYKADIKNLVI